MNSVTEYLP